MLRPARALAVALAGAMTLTGCATKGYVNRTVDRFVGQERTERMAADSLTARELAALRTDLQGLRTEFGARITAMENSVKFAFPVHFAYDDATVRAEDQAALERFATVMQKYYGGAEVTVEGFADPAGTPAYNRALSKRRADAVREYLVGKGLDGAQLRTVGYGESRQVRPGAAGSAPGAELNRRVVFVVETPGQAATTTATALVGTAPAGTQ